MPHFATSLAYNSDCWVHHSLTCLGLLLNSSLCSWLGNIYTWKIAQSGQRFIGQRQIWEYVDLTSFLVVTDMLLNKQQVYLKTIMPTINIIFFCVCVWRHFWVTLIEYQVCKSVRGDQLNSFQELISTLTLVSWNYNGTSFFSQIQNLSNVCGATLPRMPTDRWHSPGP